MPDMYLPFNELQPLHADDAEPASVIADRKARRQRRKQPRLPRVSLAADVRLPSKQQNTLGEMSTPLMHDFSEMQPMSMEQKPTDEVPTITPDHAAADKMHGGQHPGSFGAERQTKPGSRLGYKRQLSDKFSAEKCHSRKRLEVAVSRVESTEREKTRLSFPSDFSQVAAAKKNAQIAEQQQ